MRGQGLMTTVLVLTVGALIAAPPAFAGDEEALFGKQYHSVSVTRDGEPKPLVEGTKLRVKFTHGDFRDSVTWTAGCNFFGAPVDVEEETLDVRRIGGTEMACIGEGLMRQDGFFVHFFRQDPAWDAEGRALILTTERVVIELQRRR